MYIEYLTHVSREYIISWALLSLWSTAGWTSRVLLADVIPWINKASLVLYMACTLCAMLRLTWCSEAVEFVSCDWKLSVSRSRVGCSRLSDSISAIEAPVSMCIRTILTTFYHMNHYACSYWASGQVFIVEYNHLWHHRIWMLCLHCSISVLIVTSCTCSYIIIVQNVTVVAT